MILFFIIFVAVAAALLFIKALPFIARVSGALVVIGISLFAIFSIPGDGPMYAGVTTLVVVGVIALVWEIRKFIKFLRK
jgi:hypothetical protein